MSMGPRQWDASQPCGANLIGMLPAANLCPSARGHSVCSATTQGSPGVGVQGPPGQDGPPGLKVSPASIHGTLAFTVPRTPRCCPGSARHGRSMLLKAASLGCILLLSAAG